MEGDGKISCSRDASFSAYLGTSKANLIIKLTETPQSPRPTIISKQEKSRRTRLERLKPDEEEIDIFGAEKYFGTPLGAEVPVKNNSPRDKLLLDMKINVKPDEAGQKIAKSVGTPSVVSEVSFSSQSALLASSLKRSSLKNQQTKTRQRFFLSGFPCKGSCLGKKMNFTDQADAAERTKENTPSKKGNGSSDSPMVEGTWKSSRPFYAKENKVICSSISCRTRIGNAKDDFFFIPSYDSGERRHKGLQTSKLGESQASQDRLISYTMATKEDLSTSMDRKLSALSWDTSQKDSFTKTTPTTCHLAAEDAQSDASSDLFEIEHLATGSTVSSFNMARDLEDCLSRSTSQRRDYEPSEASIQWSVVTASAAAADLSSIASKYDDSRLSESPVNFRPSAVTKARPNGILNCSSHKAVDVDETVFKRHEKGAKF